MTGMTCPCCQRFAKARDLRCYDYRIGWMCIHCEGGLKGAVLINGKLVRDGRMTG